MEAEKKVIVYFGMGFLPDQNAVACREQAMGCIINAIGYKPILIGISDNIPFGEFEKKVYDDVECYSIRYARSITDRIKDTFVVEKTLIHILEVIGVQRIKCFIMQDYQLRPMKQMLRFCRSNQIAFSVDMMDWFTPTRDYSWVKNISKTIDTFFRMHWFYPSLKNKICITHKFEDYFTKRKKSNSIVLPCTCKDIQEHANQLDTNVDDKVTITFAGFLGRKCEKEKLDWLIQALYENRSTIELRVVGITQEMFAEKVPNLADQLTEHIHFYGYMPRNMCIDLLRKSDFAVIVRKKSKLTEYGFSSKICEAFAHGIPVIATNTSDNGLYIRNGVNGYVCEANYESVRMLLSRIEKLKKAERGKLRQNLREENPLSIRHYVDDFSAFIRNLEI